MKKQVESHIRMQQYKITQANFRQLILPFIRNDAGTMRNLSQSGQFFRQAIPEAIRNHALAMFRTFVQPRPATFEEISPNFKRDEDGLKLIKVVVLGDVDANKSQLICKYANTESDLAYKSTIGVDFKLKLISIGERVLQLQIWDTAGQERHKRIATSYLKDAKIIYYICDMQSPETFKSLERWIKGAQSVRPEGDNVVDMILIKNKNLCTAAEMHHLQVLAETYNIVAYHAVEDNPAQVEKAFNVGVRYFLTHEFALAPKEQEEVKVSKCCVM